MNRKSELSLMNILLCLMVIFIHISATPVVSLPAGTPRHLLFFVPWRLFSCAVQGFIFLSAVKLYLHPPKKGTYGSFLGKRVKKILLPYVLVGILFFFIFNALGTIHVTPWELPLRLLDGNLLYHLYFIPLLFQFYLLRPLWDALYKLLQKPWVAILSVFVSFAVSVFSLYYLSAISRALFNWNYPYTDRTFLSYLVYWIFGMAVGIHYDTVKDFVKRHQGKLLLLTFAVMAVESVFSIRLFRGTYVENMAGFHAFYSLFGILFLYIFSLAFGNRMMNTPLAKSMDGSSYYVYLLHPLFLAAADVLISRATILGTAIPFLVRAIFTYGGTFLFCHLYLKSPIHRWIQK